MLYNNMNYNDYKEKYYDMKKTLCIIFAITLLGMGLIGCKKEAEKGYTTVESKSCDFTIDRPDSWEVAETNGMISIYNPDDVSKANITAFSFFHGLENDPLAIDYWQTYKEQLGATFGEITVNEEKETTLSGQTVAHCDYTVSIGNENFSCETILVIYNKKAYTVTLTQGARGDPEQDNYNDHSDEFAEIIKTFRIK